MGLIETQRLMEYVREKLEAKPVVELVEQTVAKSPSVSKEREGVFTRSFLCPAIKEFFDEPHIRQELGKTADQICKGLGTEGFEERGFGFTPARKRKHLFTKSTILNSAPPKAWLVSEKESLSRYQACPDFAIRGLLSQSVVGEVKYFRSESPDSAIRELYNASRQAIFYLGAFHGEYDSALVVVADASRSHAFYKGLELIKPELLSRFGPETNIHLLAISLK